jgi:hypothetical protein
LAIRRLTSFSNDPDLVTKVNDVVGLYLQPPERAVVLCVDEKSQIQALQRTGPVRRVVPGRPEQRTHDYVRHGTTTLFAALECPVLSPSCSDASAVLVPQLGLPEDLLGGAAAGPAAGVDRFGVVVAEIALQVEPEPGLVGDQVAGKAASSTRPGWSVAPAPRSRWSAAGRPE